MKIPTIYGAIFVASGFLISVLFLNGLFGSITGLIFLMAGLAMILARLSR